MPIENPARVAFENRGRNVTDTTPQPDAPPRIMVGTLAWSEHLADQRPEEFIHASADNIERAHRACVARIRLLQEREEAVKAVKRLNGDLFAADQELVSAFQGIGADYDKVKIWYDPPLDNLANSLMHLLLDHNDIVARACGGLSLDAALAKARAREQTK